MHEREQQQRLFQTDAGQHIQKCIQCGTCSGSCPLTDVMDHGPRELFAMIRDGLMREALEANTPWYCVSCYQCTVRCPRKIPVTDIFYTLKQMAMQNGLYARRHKMPDLYRAFCREAGR